MTQIRKVWLDCDPGIDDMLAIALAGLSPEQIDLVGVSTSAGNSIIENTTQNALDVLYEIGRSDVEVYQGSPGPICGELKTSSNVHGELGMGGAKLKTSAKSAILEDAFLAIYQKIMQQSTQIEFVVTGAMTNLAILIKAFPSVKNKLRGITIMGGAIGYGNMTPSAQFNLYTDPEAAHIVFNSGVKVVMVPLQLTHSVGMTEKIFAQLQAMNQDFANKVYQCFKYYSLRVKDLQGLQYPVAHDPCTIYYLMHGANVRGRDCYVDIELIGKSRGRTLCQFYNFSRANCFVCEKIDVGHFWTVMLNAIRKVK